MTPRAAGGSARSWPRTACSPQAEWPRGQAIECRRSLHRGQRHRCRRPPARRKLGPALGTSIVVDNRAGAGGTLGAALVAKAPPDGYTLARAFGGPRRQPGDLRRTCSYDTLKDFSGITPLRQPAQRAGHRARSASRTCATWSSRRRAKPGTLNYGSAGNGSATHMNAEVLPLRRRPAGAARAVPGNARGADRGDGRPHRLVLRADGARPLPLVQSGELKALAVGTAKRSDVAAAAADDGRGRRARLGVPVLGRPVRAGQDAGGRSSTGCTTEVREDHGLAGAEGAPRQARRRGVLTTPAAFGTSFAADDREDAAARPRRRNQAELDAEPPGDGKKRPLRRRSRGPSRARARSSPGSACRDFVGVSRDGRRARPRCTGRDPAGRARRIRTRTWRLTRPRIYVLGGRVETRATVRGPQRASVSEPGDFLLHLRPAFRTRRST